MISDKEKYINLSTQKKDSTLVNTPVWFAQEEDKNSFYVFSHGEAGKVKRIRNFSSVKVATCNFKGDLHGEWLSAEAKLLNKDQEESIKLGYRLLHKKYPSMRILDIFSKLSGNYKKRQLIEFKFKDTS
jgi:PPOX class probable F420-dependent enzyme